MTDAGSSPVVLIGIDWADKEHFYSAVEPSGKSRSGSFKQTQADIAQWVNDWKQKFPNVRLLIAIETSRGALINALMEYSEVTIYPINPAALASYRKSFRHGGGKNDRTDAKLILKYLQRDRDELHPLVNNSAETKELETLTTHRRSLVNERVALGNRLMALLKCYLPAVLALKPTDIHAKFVLALLRQYPTLALIQAAGADKLRKLFFATGTKKGIERRIEILMTAVPLTTNPVTIDTHARLCRCIVSQMELLNLSIKGYDAEIEEKVVKHVDYAIFKDLPGIGYKTIARMIASLGDDRNRYRTADAFQAAAGIAPLTDQSGGSVRVHARWAATLYIKQTFHEYAGLSIASCEWAKRYYELQISRGKAKQTARRALAYKWIRIIYRCWQDGQPYNESHYLKRLSLTQSPVAQPVS